VLWATGNENSGVSVFVQDDRLVVDYNSFNDHTVVESSVPVPVGDSTLHVHLERDSRTTGWAEVLVDGQAAGRGEIRFYMRMVSSVGSSVGFDHGSAVSDRYDAPYAFTGTLHDVTVQLPGRRPTPADTEATGRSEMTRQ
jgi:arylsulfatase